MSHILKNRLVMTRLDVVIRFLNIAGENGGIKYLLH